MTDNNHLLRPRREFCRREIHHTRHPRHGRIKAAARSARVNANRKARTGASSPSLQQWKCRDKKSQPRAARMRKFGFAMLHFLAQITCVIKLHYTVERNVRGFLPDPSVTGNRARIRVDGLACEVVTAVGLKPRRRNVIVN